MYLRNIHAEHHLPTLWAFIRANPLGIFTTAITSTTGSFPLLQSSHIPFLLDSNENSQDNLGTLRGHMARANPQAKAMIESLKSTAVPEGDDGPRILEQDVMILFNGPSHHYVTPKFYTETKPATGKVVPTWNYSAVQAYGRAKVYFDSKSTITDKYLAKQVGELSHTSEMDFMGYQKPWSVDDAPKPYIDALKKAIIGIEVEITDIGGKWKMSQEIPAGDRKGVVDGFKTLDSDIGQDMAETVKEREELMEKRKLESRA